MLQSSAKNLRLYEAYYLYCIRNNKEYHIDGIMKFMEEYSETDHHEFNEICKEVRQLDVNIRRVHRKSERLYRQFVDEIDGDYEKLLARFGTDEYKQLYRERRLKGLLEDKEVDIFEADQEILGTNDKDIEDSNYIDNIFPK